MVELNLIDKVVSQIPYRVDRFPDGQQQVVITDPVGETPRQVTIKARLRDFKDLELIVCAVASLRGMGARYIHLYTPYFLGARSDRKFEQGGNNYLKEVICPIINSLKLESVTVLDPHSDVLEACLNNFNKRSNIYLVDRALATIGLLGSDDFILVAPDSGATKKVFNVAEGIEYKGKVYVATKDRDSTGALSKQSIPGFKEDAAENLHKDIVIIDDICDGGKTFVNLSKLLRESQGEGRLFLIVTHGVFSKGVDELRGCFDGIFTTSSFSDETFNQQVWRMPL